MTTSAWIVTGTVGEYSDRRWWIVASFSTEEGAQGYRAALEADAERIVKLIEVVQDDDPPPGCPRWALDSELDPFRLDDKWTDHIRAPRYTVQKVPHDAWEHMR